VGRILALDIGTGTVRAALFDLEGRPVGEVVSIAYEIDTVTGHPEFAEVTCDKWVAAARSAIAAVSQAGDVSAVRAIGVSGLFPGLVMFGATGRPLRPAILYSDRRSQTQLDGIRRSGLATEMETLGGSCLTTGTTSVTSLLWCREAEPDTFARTRMIAHVNGLVAQWLTGRIAMDRSNAALTGLFDTQGGRWSAEMCAALEIDPALLPELVEGCDAAGELLPGPAGELGLLPGIPVAMGGGDTACAAMGVGCVNPGDFVTSCGTTDTLALCVDRYVFDPRLYCVGHVVPDRFLSIAPMSCTGGCLSWYARELAGDERRRAQEEGRGLYAVVEEHAATAPPGAGGVVFLPYLRGERTPVNDPSARAVLFGMTDATDRAAVARAVMEGVAYGVRHCLEAMEEAHGLHVDELTIVGKPTRSALWNQIRADVTQRRIRALAFEERSLLGAAVLGARAAGLVSTGDSFIYPHAVDARVFEPRTELADLYSDGFTTYRSLYAALAERGLFRGAVRM